MSAPAQQSTSQQSGTQQQPASSIHNLGTLLKRLEAATSRLEDIALAQQSQQVIGHIPGPSALPAVAAAPAGPGNAAAATAPAPEAKAEHDSPAITAYKEVLDGPLKKYGELSEGIGGVVAEQAKYVVQAFTAQLEFLNVVSHCKKIPTSDPQFGNLLKPTSEKLMKVTDIKDSNRAEKKLFNHLSEVAEGIPGLAWVTLDQKPAPFVGDMKDSAQFYANRVVKDFKESDPKQVKWARSFTALLEDLKKYVMAHHTTGLSWNAKGQDVASYLASASSSPTSSSSAPPPPPPPSATGPPPPPPAPGAPGAPPPPAPGATAPKAKAGDMSAVFSDLNKGGSVTSGLRKVDKAEMTHKNPSLRGTSAVPAGTDESKLGASRPSIPKKPASFQKKPAKTELDGNKWMVENHEGNKQIMIEGTEISHTVNIFGCKNSVVQVKGKVNAISMVSCSKTSILLESTVSALSITSSPSFTVQILGLVPTILIDSTDSGQIYLSKESMGVEIITSKTSGLNISLPLQGGEEGEFVERAVPEQMKTVVVDGKLKTEIVEHAG